MNKSKTFILMSVNASLSGTLWLAPAQVWHALHLADLRRVDLAQSWLSGAIGIPWYWLIVIVSFGGRCLRVRASLKRRSALRLVGA